MSTLPFHVDKLFRRRVEGTAVALPEGIKLVFFTPKDEAGLFDNLAEEFLISWSDVKSVEAEKGIFEDQLVVRLNSLSNMPEKLRGKSDQPTLHLDVRKKDREEIKPFLASVQAVRSGQQTIEEESDQFVDEMRDFLDRM